MRSFIRIKAADDAKTNLITGHWRSVFQVAAQAGRLYKLSVTNLTVGDLYVWFFNNAAVQSAVSNSPEHVRFVPAGFADTWDLGTDGALFKTGIGIIVASVAPTDPTTTATAAGLDSMILRAEFALTQW